MTTTFENHHQVFQTQPKQVDLGKIEVVSPQTVWRDDAAGFMQWLSKPENLPILSRELQLELEVVPRENPWASILCKEVGSNRHVLVSTQLERTDHEHLGALLTYASGLEATTIVWISRRITEEHRSCIDWLNRLSGLSFFGLELELWRIDSSKPAPKFNVVVQPNEWVKSTAEATPDAATSQLRYWTQFYDILFDRGGPMKPTKPHAQAWMTLHPFPHRGFFLKAFTQGTDRKIGVSLEITGEDAASYLAALAEHRATVESELGMLSWSISSAQREYRIIKTHTDSDPLQESDWPRQHEWLAVTLDQFHRAFAELIDELA